MVDVTKDGEMSFRVESVGDSVEVSIDDDTVSLVLPNHGAKKLGTHLIEEAEKSE